jgi:hypothetical protein
MTILASSGGILNWSSSLWALNMSNILKRE